MPNVDRLESLADIPAINKEFEVIITNLNQVRDVIGDLGKLESFTKSATSMKQLRDASDKLNSSIGNEDSNTRKLISTQIQLDKVKQKLTFSESAEAKQIALLNLQLAESNKQNKLAAALENAIPASIDYHKAKVVQLTAERDKLILSESADRDILRNLNAEIDANNLAIIANVDLEKQRIANIGNYNGQLGILSKSLKGIGGLGLILTRALGIDPVVFESIREAGRAIRDVRHASEGAQLFNGTEATNSTIDTSTAITSDTSEIDNTSSKVENSSVIKDNTAVVEDNSASVTNNSETVDVNTKSTEEKTASEIEDTSAIITETTSEEINTDAVKDNNIVSEENVIVSQESVLVEKEETVSEIQNTIATETNTEAQEENIAAEVANKTETQALTLAQKIYAFAVGESTGAMKIFRIALLGLGILAVIALLAILFTSFNKAYAGTTELSKGTDNINNSNKKLSDSTNKFIDDLSKQTEEIKKAKDELKDYLKTAGEIKNTSVAGSQSDIALVQALSHAVLDGNKSYNERNNALLELKEINKDYFGNLTLESDKLSTLKSKVDEYTNSLIASAVVKGFQDEIGKVSVEISKQESAYVKAGVEVDKYSKALKTAQDANDKNIESLNKATPGFLTGDITKADKGHRDAVKIFETEAIKLKVLKDQYNDLNVAIGKAVDESLKFTPLKTPPIKKDKHDADDDIFKHKQDLAKAEFETLQKTLQSQIDSSKAIVDDDKKSFEERIIAEQNYYDLSLELIQKKKEYEDTIIDNEEKNEVYKATRDISDIKKRDSAIQTIHEEYAQKRLLNIASENEEINKLTQTDEKKRVDLITTHEKQIQDHEKSLHDQRLIEIQNNYDQQLVDLDTQYAEILIRDKNNKDKLKKDEEDYNRKKLLIQAQQQAAILASEIQFAEEQIAIAKAVADAEPDGPKKTVDLDAIDKSEKSLASLKIKYAKIIADFNIKNNQDQTKSDDEKTAKFITNLQRVADQANSIFSTIGDIIKKQTQSQSDYIDSQIKGIEDKKQADIDAENASADAADDKQQKINKINAIAAANEAALNDKKKAAQRRQAEFEKAANIVSIIGNTAVAVTKFLSKGDIVEAIIAGVEGAAELAIVVSTPIPQFKTGGKHKGGLMIVGDGGKSEALKFPDGTILKSPATPTLVDAPADTIIYPDYSKMMMQSTLTTTPQFNNESNYTVVDSNAAIGRMERNIVTAIKSQPKLELSSSEAGMVALLKYGINQIKYINDQTNWRSN